MRKGLVISVYGNALLLAALSLYLFIAPLFIVLQALGDPALASGGTPRFAFRWHRSLSGDFETWARARVSSGQASALSVHDISGTEWPVFSAVYYLWATEALQEAWQADPSSSSVMPKEYARGAIQAAADLVADPNHAAWVKQHWGEEYLERENLFYRMLLISGLASYQKLSGDARYESLLSAQVESLALELDASPYGLLDDYPGQCYPIDILPAIAAIRRADAVLGTDHAAFAARAVRGFEGDRLDSASGLPAYSANSRTGQGIGPARGVGVSYMLIWAPELWPDTAERWYALYESQFWQRGPLTAGVREFALRPDRPSLDWFLEDVDAGPVLAGYGTAASAFGIGAARANGRLDHAHPLSVEALMVSWPLPDGTLLLPRLLSNLSDAPYIGEAILLFNFTRRPVTGGTLVPPAGGLPAVVLLVGALYVIAGGLLLMLCLNTVRRWRAISSNGDLAAPGTLFVILTLLGMFALWTALFVSPLVSLPALLLAQAFAGNPGGGMTQ
jgi:hypothetical protein